MIEISEATPPPPHPKPPRPLAVCLCSLLCASLSRGLSPVTSEPLSKQSLPPLRLDSHERKTRKLIFLLIDMDGRTDRGWPRVREGSSACKGRGRLSKKECLIALSGLRRKTHTIFSFCFFNCSFFIFTLHSVIEWKKGGEVGILGISCLH